MPEPELLANFWPNDLFLLRHADPDRDDVQRPNVEEPGWYQETQLIDMYQELKQDIGFRQGRAVGQRLAREAPLARFCLSGDADRHLQTSWELVKMYPESNRPTVVPTFLLRERNRGADSPILISKSEFYEQFLREAEIRETTPSKWQPRMGEPYKGAQIRLNMALMFFSMQCPHEEQLIVSTSGEMCIASFNNPLLGNMSDEQLVQGFGPGMPAKEYELTAITHYTKRNPFDKEDPNVAELYTHMRVMTPNPANPEGELAWDTGWLPIER